MPTCMGYFKRHCSGTECRTWKNLFDGMDREIQNVHRLAETYAEDTD